MFLKALLIFSTALVVANGSDTPDDCTVAAAISLKQCGLNLPPYAEIYKTVCNYDCTCNHGSPIGGNCNWAGQDCRCIYPPNTNFATTNNKACIFVDDKEAQKAMNDLIGQMHHHSKIMNIELPRIGKI